MKYKMFGLINFGQYRKRSTYVYDMCDFITTAWQEFLMQKTTIEKYETYSMWDLQLPCIWKKYSGSYIELNYPLGWYSLLLGHSFADFIKKTLKYGLN